MRRRTTIERAELSADRMKSQDIAIAEIVEFAGDLDHAQQRVAVWQRVGAVTDQKRGDEAGRSSGIKVLRIADQRHVA